MTSLSVETLENLRVLSEPEAIRLTGISKPTWERMRARGETAIFANGSRRVSSHRS
jgi:predicted DNA-binding transcriptional regulator AlpA